MLELKELVNHIQSEHPLFKEAFVHDRQEGNLSGITDKYPNYFFLELSNKEHSYSPVEYGEYIVSAPAKLIAGFKDKVAKEVVEALIGTLIAKNYQISASNQNAEQIYEEETGEKLPKQVNLIRINFVISELIDLEFVPGCKNRLC